MNTITARSLKNSSPQYVQSHPAITHSKYNLIPYGEVVYHYVNGEGKKEFIVPARIRALSIWLNFRARCYLSDFNRWWEMKMMLPNREVLPASLPLVSDLMYQQPECVHQFVEEMAKMNCSSKSEGNNFFPDINRLKLDYLVTLDAIPSVQTLSPAAGLAYKWLGCSNSAFKLMTGTGTRKIKVEIDWEALHEGRPIQYKTVVTDAKDTGMPVIPNYVGVIYSCKGVCRPDFYQSFSELVRQHDPVFVILRETISCPRHILCFMVAPSNFCGGASGLLRRVNNSMESL